MTTMAAPIRLARRGVPITVTAVVIVAAWQFMVWALKIDSFVLPAPSDIATALREQIGTILDASTVTIRAVLIGLAMGSAAGVLASLVISRFRRISAPVLTVAVIANCAPIVALAPIFNNWLGVTNIMSKAGIAAIMVFFPVLVNTTRGLLQVNPLQLEVMESMAAKPRQITLLLRFPTALPYLFNGLKLGTTLSVIGVIVGEYFGGPSNALGVYIAQMASLPRYAEAWAGILVASCLGLALFGLMTFIERVAMPWHVSVHSE